MTEAKGANHRMRDCICADPENCTQPVPGRRCRKRADTLESLAAEYGLDIERPTDGYPLTRLLACALVWRQRAETWEERANTAHRQYAEIAATAERDAARYRFMRESYDADLWTLLGRVGCARERMDAAIDAAMERRNG